MPGMKTMTTAVGGCCCEGVVITDCDDFLACLAAHSDTIEATVSGTTDGTCEDCESLNNTYLFDDLFIDETEPTCHALGSESLPATTCGISVAQVTVGRIFDGFGEYWTVQFFFSHAGSVIARWAIGTNEGTSDDGLAALQQLCNGEAVELPLQSGIVACNLPATVTMQMP